MNGGAHPASYWGSFFGAQSSSAMTVCFQIDSNPGPQEYEGDLTIQPRGSMLHMETKHVQTEEVMSISVCPRDSSPKPLNGFG
jgi:hypothetical protein